MNLEKAVRIGLGLRAARSTEMAEALSVLANEIESRDSQKPIAVVDRTLGQMFVKWADGKSLYQVEVGTKLYSRPVGVCTSDCSCPPALTVTAKTPMRYIETNEHLIDLRRVQCVSYVSDDSYRVTLVSGVTFPVDDKIYPRKHFIEQLVAYGSRE